MIFKVVMGILLSVALSLGLLAVMGQAGLDSGFIQVAVLLLASVLVGGTVLSPDYDHRRIRLALSGNMLGLARVHLRSIPAGTPEYEAARGVYERLNDTDNDQLQAAQTVLRRRSRVERALPSTLSLALDLVLLVAGAYGGALLSERFARYFPLPSSVPPLLGAVFFPLMVLVIVAVALFLLGGIMDGRQDRRDTARAAVAARNPALAYRHLMLNVGSVRQKFMTDLEAGASVACTTPRGLRGLDYLEGRAARRGQSSFNEYTWTVSQFGLGLALGALAAQL